MVPNGSHLAIFARQMRDMLCLHWAYHDDHEWLLLGASFGDRAGSLSSSYIVQRGRKYTHTEFLWGARFS